MKTKMITGGILLVLIMGLMMQCTTPPASPEPSRSFEHTLQVHLNAIQHGDIATLEPTVADSVVMIAPNGARFDSKKVFMDFHANWFKLKNWEWNGRIVRTQGADSLGYALIQYKYVQKDSTGAVQYQGNDYLVLIFQQAPQGWQLVHDQNTMIPDSLVR